MVALQRNAVTTFLFVALTANLAAVQEELLLMPLPALEEESSISQCGCNNSALKVLAPPTATPSGAPAQQQLREIVLTGFFSMDREDDGTCGGSQPIPTTGHLVPAAYIALDEINNSTDILPGYYLSLDLRDSRCDVLHTTTVFTDTIEDRIRTWSPPDSLNLGILGPGCDDVADSLAGIVSRSLRIPVVTYSANSHPLSTRAREGMPSVLFHMSRSLLLSAKSAVGLMRHFNWTDNTTFVTQEGDDIFLSTIERLVSPNRGESREGGDNLMLRDIKNDTVRSEFRMLEMGGDGLAQSNSLVEFFANMRDNSIRVVLALLTQRVAMQLVCAGKQTGLIPGDGFVYIFIGSFASNWWQIETDSCTLTEADVQSVIVVTGNRINPDTSAVLQSGRTVSDFKDEYSRRLEGWCDLSRYRKNYIDPSTGSVYDALWTLALALDENTDLIEASFEEGRQYDPDTVNAILETIKSTNFTGVTGDIQFVEGERVGADSIQQIQSGAQLEVGFFLDGKLHLTGEFSWNGSNSSLIPSAYVREDSEAVPVYLLIISAVFTVSGIVVSMLMWAFNYYHAKHKILRASSQKLNYVIIIGVISGFVTVLILSLLESPLGSLMSDGAFKALCLVRIWLLTLSFTFVYGILFARAWRIYRIFNNPWTSSRPYKDYHLMLMVLVVVAGDVLILLPWSVIDPYRRFVTPTEVDYDSYSRCVFFSCSSDYVFVWLSVIGIFKIAIITGGIVIISLVRKEVKQRKIYDDSTSLALANYITAISFVVGLPLTFLFLLANKVTLAYLASSIWVNVSSWATLVTVFMPKFYKIVIKKDSGKRYKRAQRLYYGRNFSTAMSLDIPDRTSPTTFQCEASTEYLNRVRATPSTECLNKVEGTVTAVDIYRIEGTASPEDINTADSEEGIGRIELGTSL